jgi:membrane protease YdiL (CAAX protease family)
VLLAAVLFVLFGYLLHIIKPASMLSLAAGLTLMTSWMWRAPEGQLTEVFGLTRAPLPLTALGAVAGIGTGTLLRWFQTHSFYPWPLRPFIILSISIGVTEELVFRGFFLGRFLKGWSSAGAVAAAALFHAAYKTAIFIPFSPAGELGTLGGVTFAFGLLLGYWRVKAGSIWPCVIFHAVFDLWVYGDRMTPWWVW